MTLAGGRGSKEAGENVLSEIDFLPCAPAPLLPGSLGKSSDGFT
jgi:hypothetical protein